MLSSRAHLEPSSADNFSLIDSTSTFDTYAPNVMATMTPPPPDDLPEDVGKDGTETPRRQAPGFLSKLSLASHIYGLKGILSPILWIRDWTDYFYPAPEAPNIVKVYACRSQLPVR